MPSLVRTNAAQPLVPTHPAPASLPARRRRLASALAVHFGLAAALAAPSSAGDFGLVCPPGNQIQSFTLRSGQVGGGPGLPLQLDSNVTYASDLSGNCFSFSLDSGSGLPFAAAASGAPATVISPVVVWAPGLASDPAARWINWSAGPLPNTYGFPPHSTLYAHDFTIGPGVVVDAIITLTWAVDDQLGDPIGDPAPIGGYINGVPLPALTGGNFATPTTITTSIPASALSSGVNTLYLYQRDLGCGVSGLIYSASIDVCLEASGPSCVTPPPNMRGWWPFDETFGILSNDLTAFANDGQHVPPLSGPTPVPGIVAGALSFDGLDDRVVVPATPTLDVSCEPFSVDLWVNRDVPPLTSGLQTLVSHYISNGGWIFGVDAPTGTLQLVLEGSSLRCVLSSTATVPVGVWTHVAVTVGACCGPNQRLVTFYVNGVAAGSSVASCCNLTSLGGPASIKMGNAVWISDWYQGDMDEVEYFCRVLAPSEVAALHAAGSAGKCKDSCHASWDRQLCVNFGFSTQVEATIVNNSTVGRTYSYSIAENGNCPVTGLTYSPSNGTVFVGPGGSATVFFTATVPGPFSVGQACFDVTFTNLSSGIPCTAGGTIISEICGIIVVPDLEVVEVALDDDANATFRVIAGPGGGVVPFQLVAMPSDMVSTDTALSLNGLPPGEPVFGELFLAPNQEAIVPVNIAFNTCGALFTWTDVIFKTQTADGTVAALSSFGVRMVEAQSCFGDLNDDGFVNGADLGILLADWGTDGPGDLNGDGVVDGADLGLLLGAWGPCA